MKTKERYCCCCWCCQSRIIENGMALESPKISRAIVDHLLNRLCNVEQDVNYWEVVASGKWPSAKKIALEIVKRAEEYERTA